MLVPAISPATLLSVVSAAVCTLAELVKLIPVPVPDRLMMLVLDPLKNHASVPRLVEPPFHRVAVPATFPLLNR